MSRKHPPEKIAGESEIVALRLPVPERDVIITSRHVAELGLQDRVRNARPREAITFNLDELEDLHRGLAFESDQTLDTKRRKTIAKILQKIEEFLGEEDYDEDEPWFDEWDEELPVPRSPQEIFEHLFGAVSASAGETPPPCRIAMTAAQRETLRGMDTISLDIQKMLAVESQNEQEFEFTPRQMLMVSLAIKEAIDQSSDEKSAMPYREIAQQISEALFSAIEEADSHGTHRQRTPANVAYQLKIVLEGSKPPIWRRVLIADCTLDVLHQIVQAAMGWTNSHLHMFEYGGDRFSDPRFELDAAEFDETQVCLSQLVADGCQKLRYCYDFGDDWSHSIKIEKTLPPLPADQSPKCIKGEGACPPEDCGGIWGYYEFLHAIRDPKHKRHEEFVEWAGKDFDPNDFDIEEVNEALAQSTVDTFDS